MIQNKITINYLEKLKAQKDAGDERQLNDELARTDGYLQNKNRKQHEGKAVLISADALATLLEAVNGDKRAVDNHVTVDNWHFSDRDVVTLLESAVAESEKALKSLSNPERNTGLYNIESNFEVIGHLTLDDITHIASEMELEYEEQKLDFTELSAEQTERIVTKIIGEPIDNLRDSIADLGDGRSIRKLMRKHIEQVIREELNLPAK